MLLVVMLVGMVAALFVFGIVDTTALVLRRDQDTAEALAQAKRALIGRAAADDNRPGSLPCPDTDDDGVAELFAGVDCPSYVGRLPWKSLGLPDPRDSAGERLWYVLSPAFRDYTAAGMLDSDTKGSLTVYQDSVATAITTEGVAVIFAPGPAVAGQVRDPASANNPANYLDLDATSGVNNAIAGGPFMATQGSATFNDRLLAITTADLIPIVEMRVAREMLALLSAYRANSACGCYPWAANDFDDDSVTGRRRGGVPMEDALPEPWGSGTIPSVPSWIAGASPNNKWGGLFYYAVAPGVVETPTAGALTVDGASKDVVLITTGPAGASRPSSILADYLEDLENRNNDDIFCQPGPSAMAPCTPTTAYARDRLYTVP
jgi:type II secretory pathway pseudopilin PulG